MFIPLHDANELKRIKLPVVTIAMIVVNFVVYALTLLEGEFWTQGAVIEFGYIPAVVFDHADLPPDYAVIPEQLTYLTYAFFHADFLHIAGNMLFLWVFGDNVEDAMGHGRFLVFYLACAVAGAAFHGFLDPESQAPLIGASGAVAGIIAAYLILHPRVKVWVLAFGRIPLRIPAWIALAGWIVFQFAMFFSGLDEQVSFSAHIGGIAAGALLVLVLRRRDQPVLDKQLVIPRAMVRRDAGAVPAVPASRWGRQ